MATPAARRGLCRDSALNQRPIRPRKRFGQHYLRDDRVIQRLVAAIRPTAADCLVEIGPGLGALTKPLLQAVGQLQVVELDRDLIPRLEKNCAGLGELQIHQADALRFDFATLSPTTPSQQQLRIVGNLPYNISTPLLFHLLAQAEIIRDMHFMLQQEVVNRLAAQPGNSDYGRLSIMVQYRSQVEPLFSVAADAFNPPPQVQSAVVRLEPYPHPPQPAADETRFAALVAQAFNQRRKTLRNSLRGWLSADAISAVGIDPSARPETLSLAEFVALSNHSTQNTQKE